MTIDIKYCIAGKLWPVPIFYHEEKPHIIVGLDNLTEPQYSTGPKLNQYLVSKSNASNKLDQLI